MTVMRIRLMRSVDRFLGIPLCWLLSFVMPAYRRTIHDGASARPAKILVIKFFGFGSIVLSTSALSIIKTLYPGSELSFLSFKENKDLLERMQLIDEVITIRRNSMRAFVRDTLAVVARVIRSRYDIVFDLEFFSKYSTLMSGITNAPIRLAFALPARWRSRIVNHPVQLKKGTHVIDSFCQLVLAVSHSTVPIPTLHGPTITDQDHQALLRKIALGSKKVIAVNINAGETFLERRWPPEKFAELVRSLAPRDESTFCFIGSPQERDYVEKAIRKTECTERCINVAGLLSIPELGALLQRSEMLISNDSGPLHLASALGIPTIGLFGPESPEFYGTYGSESRTVYKKIACSPCMNVYSAKDFRCPYNARCMKEISVEEVTDLIRAMNLAA